MISLYDSDNTIFEGMGDCVLMPTSCKTHQIAGGGYTLTMVHPMDEWGKWRHIVEEAVIRAPVQEEIIESAYDGQELWVYETIGAEVLRDSASEPRTVTYQNWSPDLGVGDKCTYNGRNYQCTYFDQSSGVRYTPPPESPWWRLISGTSGGGTVVASLPAGTTVYWIGGTYADTWWQVETTYGIQGWIKQSSLTNERHQTPETVQPRRITTQLFRIRKVTIDSEAGTVTAEAEHVSYDASGTLIQFVSISKASAGNAIAKVLGGLVDPWAAGIVATNLTGTDGTVTKDYKGKSLIYALLDPDNGIVPALGAALKRDNWDLFVLKKTDTDRGFRLRRGKNISGVNWERDSGNLITRVVPVAKKEDGDTLYLPELYIDSSFINSYPVVRTEQLNVSGQIGKDDGTDTDTAWTESALLNEMRARAQNRFDVDHVDTVNTTITVDFEMLGDTAEFAQFKALERALLYDIVYVIEEKMGLNTQVRVTEVEWDCIRETVTGLVLTNVNGYVGGTVAGYTVKDNSIDVTKISGAAIDSIVALAADRAVQILS